MSDTLNWYSLYNTGIHEIDLQHRTLLALCNELTTAINEQQPASSIQDIISDFIGYLIHHNSFEEKLMKVFEYPNRRAHVNEHQALTGRLRQLLKPHDDNDNLSRDSQHLLLETLAEHISGDDLELGQFLIAHIPPNINPLEYAHQACADGMQQ